MKKRSLGKMIFLFVTTLGLYRFYWLIKTRNELIEKTKIDIPSIWLYLIPYIFMIGGLLLFLVTSIAAEVSYQDTITSCELFNTAEYCVDVHGDQAEPGAWGIAGIISFYATLLFVMPLVGWWYWKYAQAVEAITKEKMSFAVGMLIILAVPDGFDMIIVQDSFNKVATTK